MFIEPQHINVSRQYCHKLIIDYAKRKQSKGKLDIGPIFCCDIQYEHECPHANPNGCCFVNYGKH